MLNLVNAQKIRKIGKKCYLRTKLSDKFPVDTGWLRDHSVVMHPYATEFDLLLLGKDVLKTGYLAYLQEGTRPHDIPGAFGRPLPFGIGGKFDGKFHPGSTKHVGFIEKTAIKAVLDYHIWEAKMMNWKIEIKEL